MFTRGMSGRGAVATALAGGTLLASSGAAQAATLDDYEITGVQFVNEDCSRNEYAVTTSVTGTVDDGGGFDRFRVEVWDDGVLKDSRDREVEVGTSRDIYSFLSFVGLYGTGAPGVGIVIDDIDGAGNSVGTLAYEDPFYPEDVDGPCSFDIERIGGETRLETAAMLSAQKFVSADTVIIATSRTYPDALAAAPWAAQLGAPLLLSNPTGLSAATTAELARLQPSSVIVIGGEAALGEGVLDDVAATLPGALVERVGGASRYETSAMIAGQVLQDSTAEVYVASGQGFADALVLSALAARHQAPLVLVRQDDIPSASAAVLATLDFDHLYAAGGPMVLSDAVLTDAADGVPVTRYAGADRYGTAAQVLEQFPAEGRVMVATGADFPDSLTSVPVAARTGAGVALTRPDSVPAAVMTQIDRLIAEVSFPLITIVGGPVAVNPSVEAQLQTLFSSAAAPASRPSGTLTESNIPTE
ncbi:hypothetical protein GCM10011366_09090 [Ornithinimicrobium tianjinense]|uniref:Cell wall binding repeat 2 n=2 Tax=Ornithinimicrobium tianjinense TaxID=1195761 RepID=A0A917F4X1_9MICO|nr:hypothetical protein GCM10011366_09090 [Ornithinimicrobium tianjinense]